MKSGKKLAQCTWLFVVIVAHTRLADVTRADQPSNPMDGFHAYYTRVQSEKPFERFCRTGDEADIVVNIRQPEGHVVFWRGQSYLPYWQTAAGRWPFPEVVTRRGDGDGAMPDRVNTFSHVQIIEQLPDRVLIHWHTCLSLVATIPTRVLTRQNSLRNCS